MSARRLCSPALPPSHFLHPALHFHQTLSEGSGEIGSMGTVISCVLSTYIIDADCGKGGDSQRPEEQPVERSECEQFKIGEGDAVPGGCPVKASLLLPFYAH